MARNVDERIVEMQFNNKQFESGVKESIDSLDKLKHSLDLEGAAKSFSTLDNAASKVNFNPLQNGIEVVTHKLSALEIVGITALQRITNQAMATGERLIKSFTIDPVMSGWNKYEQKVESVQKILNSSADNTMPKVEAALEKIGWFTDETSYQFDAMVSTLGSFSAAGIELEDATNTIIGLANAAAISGVNAENASHGFLGFQRAIGSGYLSLGIWNSYLKTAGFQSQAFIDGCIKAAEELGELKKGLDGVYRTAKGSEVTLATFGETLQEKWVNKDVIKKMAQNFSVASDQLYAVKDNYDMITDAVKDLGDQLDQYSLKAFLAGQETKTWGDAVEYVKGTVAQGWSKTWEMVFGNYEEAKEFYGTIVEQLYELFVVSGNTRNEVLGMWRALGGAAVFRKALINLMNIVIKVVDTVRKAFTQLFPIFDDNEGMAKFLNKLSLRFEHLTKIALKAFDKIEEATKPAREGLGKLAEGIKKTNDAGQQTAKVLESISEMAKRVIRGEFGNGEDRIKQLKELGYCYEEVQNTVNELMGSSYRYTDEQIKASKAAMGLTEENEGLSESAKHVAVQIDRVYTTFDNLVSTFRGVIAVYQIVVNLFQAIVRVGSELINPLGKIGDGFLGITGSIGDALVSLKDWLIETDFFYTHLKKVADFISTVFGPAFEVVGEVLDQFKNRNFKTIVDWFTQLSNSVKSMFNKDVENKVTNFATGFRGINASIKPVVDLSNQFINVTDKATKKTNTFSSVISILASAFDIFWSILKAVGKAVSGFAGPALDTVSKGLGTVATFFKDFVDKKWDAKIFNLKDGIKQFFVNLIAGATSIDGFKEKLELFKNANLFKGVFTALFDVDFSLSNLIQVIKDKFKELKEIFGLDKLVIVDPVREFFMGIGKVIGDGVDAIKSVLAKIDFRKIFAAAGFGALIYLVIQVGNLSGHIGKFIKSCNGIAQGISGIIGSIKTTIKIHAISTLIWSIIALIAALTAALYILAEKVSTEKLGWAWAAISTLLVIIGKVINDIMLFSSTANTKGVLLAAGIMAAFGFMFLAIASAMNIMIGMDMNAYFDGLAKLAGILAAMLFVLWLLDRIKIGQDAIDWKSMAGFLIFVIAIKNVTQQVLELSKAEDPNKVWNAIGMLGAIALEMALIARSLSGVSFSGAAGMGLMAISIKLFVGVIKDLADEDFRKIYESMLKLLPVIGLMLTITTFAGLFGKNGLPFAAMMLSIGLMIKAIGSSLEEIASIKPEDLKRAEFALSGMMAALLVTVMLIALISEQMEGPLTKLPKMALTMGAMGILLLSIAASLKLLAGLSWGEILPAAVSLGIVILAVCKALQWASNADLKLKPVLAMAIMIGTVCAALLIMTYLVDDWGKLKAAALAMMGVLGVVGLTMAAISKIDFGSALSSALAMMLVIATVVGAFWYLLQQDITNLLDIAKGLTLVIGTTTGAILLLQLVPWPAAMTAALSLVSFIGIVTVAMAALADMLGQFKNWDEISTGLDRFIELFEKLGKGLGGLISGFLEGLVEKLPGVGSKLSGFGSNVKSFIDTFSDKTVDWDTVGSAIGNLVKAINDVKYVQITTDQAQNVKMAMGYLGDGLKWFYDRIRIAKINVTQAKSAAEAIDILFGVLRNKEKIDPKIWENLSAGLDALGNALVNFSGIVTGEDTIDEGAINKAIRVVKSLGRAATEIGDLGDFSGWGRLLQFSNEVDAEGKPDLSGLTQLAEAIVAFNDAIKPAISGDDGALDASYLTTAIGAVKDLVTIAGDVPNAGGQLAEWFGGFQGWTTISTDLETLGDALVKFADKTKDLKTDDMNNGFDALRDLNSLAHELDDPFTGGLVQDILGDNTLGGLADALEMLSPKLVDFATVSRGLKPEETSRSFTILNNIVQAAKDVYGYSLISAGNEIDQFCTYFKSAYETLASTDADSDYVSRLISDFRNLFNADTIVALGDIGRQMSEAMATAFSSDPAVVQDSVNTFVSYYVNNFIDHTIDFEETGRALRTKFKIAFSGAEARNDINDSVDAMADEMVAKIRTHYGSEFTGMRGAGSYLIGGLIAGMTSRQQEAVDFAGKLAGKINSAFEGEEHISSPSKVWIKYGQYLIMGLINGIDQNVPTVVNQIQALAEAMNGAFDDTINLEAQAEGITPVYQSSLDSLNTSSMVRRAAGISSTRDYSTAMAAAAGNGTFTIQNLTVNGTENMDVNELSDAVIDKLNRQIASENSRWAY